jgi:hypothetical protein
MEIILASPPDREFLVAELWAGDEQWAEVNREAGAIRVEIYGRRDGQPWLLDVDEALSALGRARSAVLDTARAQEEGRAPG